jgi:hypothetical protein
MTQEFDQYKVKVILKCISTGHHDKDQFPDRECYMDFDATDANIQTMLDQYKDFLSFVGYVIRPDDEIKLVKHYD